MNLPNKLTLSRIILSFVIILLLLMLMPLNILAYSDKIIPAGQTLGIEVKNNGIIVAETESVLYICGRHKPCILFLKLTLRSSYRIWQ